MLLIMIYDAYVHNVVASEGVNVFCCLISAGLAASQEECLGNPEITLCLTQVSSILDAIAPESICQ